MGRVLAVVFGVLIAATSALAGGHASLKPLVFRASSGRVKNGQERFICHQMHMPASGSTEIGRVQMFMPAGGHHVDVYRPVAGSAVQWPPKDCPTTINFSDWELVSATQSAGFNWTLPPGVAIDFSARQPLLIQTHFLATKGTHVAKTVLYPVD